MTQQDKEFYGELAPLLSQKEALILGEVRAILDGISTDSETALAEHLKSRIKSSSSMCEKLLKKGLEPSAEEGLKYLSDIIGLRVVVHFVGDVYTILHQIKQSDQWTVVNVKDYIENAKPNGYRSLHIILSVPFAYGELNEIRAEIQLRTIAMDCWASLEHQLKYKKNIGNTDLIVSELKRCADEMASTDLSMQTIRDLIKHQSQE